MIKQVERVYIIFTNKSIFVPYLIPYTIWILIVKNVVSMTMQRYNKLFDWPNIIRSKRYFPMIMMSCGALVFPPK